jgi:hypothetical protein
MPFSILIKIAVITAVVGFFISRWRNKKNTIFESLEQMRTLDWQGWVEIVNSDHLPLFQGKIVAVAAAQGHTGALLLGVLLEENAPTALVTTIKARPFRYLTEGRVLVRGLTAHDKNLIMTKLEDQELIDRLCAAMDKQVKPDTCLVLNSSEIQHMDTAEAVAQFEKLWEDSLRSERMN